MSSEILAAANVAQPHTCKSQETTKVRHEYNQSNYAPNSVAINSSSNQSTGELQRFMPDTKQQSCQSKQQSPRQQHPPSPRKLYSQSQSSLYHQVTTAQQLSQGLLTKVTDCYVTAFALAVILIFHLNKHVAICAGDISSSSVHLFNPDPGIAPLIPNFDVARFKRSVASNSSRFQYQPATKTSSQQRRNAILPTRFSPRNSLIQTDRQPTQSKQRKLPPITQKTTTENRGHWIPIVSQQSSSTTSLPPLQYRTQPLASRSNQSTTETNRSQAAAPAGLAPAASTLDIIEATYQGQPFESERIRKPPSGVRYKHNGYTPNIQYPLPLIPLPSPAVGLYSNMHHLNHYDHSSLRRPRLNSGYEVGMKASKMYKRVLLCDKTLVSLDYIRNVDLSEPRPYGPPPLPPPPTYGEVMPPGSNEDFDFGLDDNVIDLDSDALFSAASTPDSRRISPPLPLSASTPSDNLKPASSRNTQKPPPSPPLGAISSPNSSNLTEAASTSGVVVVVDGLVPVENQMLESASSKLAAGKLEEDASLRRSYLLRDDDPLVRCDMWDLEKGLKNRKPPPEILKMAIKTDFDTVRDAINRCRQLSEKTMPPDDEYRDGIEIMSTEDLVSLFSMKRGLLPGTKWCGLGDQASTYNDLGPKHRIDICCRAHDHCPIRLKPFRNDYGVLNIALYTKSHCDCDADFYRCLREVKSRTADMLGNLYFNVMKLQCIREEKMKVCREMKPIALGFERCTRYEESPVKTVFKFTSPPVAY